MTFEQKIVFANTYDKELKLFPYGNTFPKLHPTVFTASGSKIIGAVEIGPYSSIWYNCVVRGDVNYIKIAGKTNIQDCSMLHVTHQKFPLTIGSHVTVGHSVSLHGCILKDLCLIGVGAVILDGAVVEENSMVAAGSLIKPGFIVPTGKLVAGVPAKIVRNLTEDEIADLERAAHRYTHYVESTIESYISTTVN
jgi:gamma-carbonic anhydrase